MKRILMLIMLLMLAGCATTPIVNTCPPFPIPTKQAVIKIRSLHDRDVDNWIVQIYKLSKQLEVCRGSK